MIRSSRALAAAFATCVLVAVVPASAGAAPTVAKLRVEAAGRSLDGGTSYVNSAARLATAPSQCEGSGADKKMSGPTAMGIIGYAKQVNPRLRPFYVSDKYSFSLIVCRIGDYGAFTASDAWLYRVNHKEAVVGGDQYTLDRGDQVLWYFADFGTGRNTGAELELRTPARVRPNQPFSVRAVAYDAEGKVTPAAGVKVAGDASAVTGPEGWATVTATREGAFRLRAARGNDIPAAPTRTCVNADVDRCPAVRGDRIVGTDRDDVIPDTAGADVISARRGADRVNVEGGSRDVVSCGGGDDRVRASGNDRVARDCEQVVRG